LNVTRAIQPVGNDTYVFYGKDSANFTSTYENGSVLIENMLEESQEPFNGSGLLTFIEFQILLVPTNETQELSGILKIKKAEAYGGKTGLWQPAGKTVNSDGIYVFKYGEEEPGDGTGFSILDYWPYIAGVVIVIIIVFLVLKKVRKTRETVEEEEE